MVFTRAHYVDGVLAPAKPGLTADPKPCAGNDGTTITVCITLYAAQCFADISGRRRIYFIQLHSVSQHLGHPLKNTHVF